MKTLTKILLFAFLQLLITNCTLNIAKAQNIAITDDDTYTANTDAMLDIKADTKGMLVPRVTTVARLAISSPPTSLLVFDVSLNQFMYYNGLEWVNLITSESDTLWGTGTATRTGEGIVYLTNTFLNMGIGSTNPKGKLEVKADITNGLEEPIFSVISAVGDTIFAVYPQGVRINVYDDTLVRASSTKGGFAVGGFSPSRGGVTNEYMRITPDSIRMYIEEDIILRDRASSTKGGFAVGGFSPSRTVPYSLLEVTDGSTQVYIGDSTAGFGVNNIDGGGNSNLMNLNVQNYFIGHQCGVSNLSGKYNTFFGYEAGLENTTGTDNIFIGYRSGMSNLSGNRNIFLGKFAGRSNSSGNENVFVGYGSGEQNQLGFKNIFVGYHAGFKNVGDGAEAGNFNTFLGSEAGANSVSGKSNVFIGEATGMSNITGSFNTYVGRWAGNNAEGDYNVFLGCEAGRHVPTVSNRLYINALTSPTYQKPLIYGEFDNKRLVIAGDQSNNPQNYTFYVNGNAGGNFSWNNLSDRRLKKNINTIPNALDKVIKLRGVNYEWKDENSKETGIQIGFIAQETNEILPEVVNTDGDLFSMQYAPITALLVEAIKEQQKLIDELKNENNDLKAQVDKISEIEAKVEQLSRILEIKASK